MLGKLGFRGGLGSLGSLGGAAAYPPFATGTSYTISGVTYPSLVSFWKLNDANVTTLAPTCVDSVAARNFSPATGQGGQTPQRPSLIARVSQERSYLFSSTFYNGFFYSGFTGAPYDKTGSDTVSMADFISPNIQRSGSERYYFLFTKNDGAYTDALSACVGYFWGVVWDGTKCVLFLHQRTSPTDWLEVRGTTDLRNGQAYHVMVTRAAGKVQANVQLYVRGTLETMALGPGSPASFTGSTANFGGACIGGRGGGGGAQTFDGWMSHFAFFSAVIPATGAGSVAGLAVQAVPPNTIYVGGTAVPVLLFADADSDIDDVGAMALLTVAQRKGLIRKIGNVINSSNVYSASAVAAMDIAKGISAFTTSYQGAGRQTTSGYAQSVSTTFNPGKTRADYAADLLTTMRTALAAEAPGTVRILTTGPLNELQLLLQSPADGISPLTGLQLVASRCTGMWIMGGYASSASVPYNFGQAAAAANYVYLNNPVPIYEVTVEMGQAIILGYGGNPTLDPIADAYVLALGGGSAYDIITAYGCVFPAAAELSFARTNATNSVNSSTGVNTWSATAGTHNQYAFATTGGAAKIAIENFMNDASYP